MKKKKAKPKNKVATQLDLIKAQNKAVVYAWAIFFITLHDKFGFGVKRLKKLWEEIESLSEDVSRGIVKVEDVLDVLRDEMGIGIQ